MNKTYIINNETSRLELQFNKEEYQNLDGATKAEIKSIFLFSGKAKAWVSREKSGYYRAIKFAEKMGFTSNGSIGVTLTKEEVETKKEEKQESQQEKNNAIYPNINIEDIETYLVSKELSRTENDNAFIRNTPIDHQQELQDTLLSANNDIIELVKSGCNNYTEYKAKTYLQSFKKKYHEQYIKVLSHKANNPSWMVTGRGGLNVSRYNKKQEQLNNMSMNLYSLIDEFNAKIKAFKYQEKQEKEQIIKAAIDENLKNVGEVLTFKRIKKDIPIDGVGNINTITDRMWSVTSHTLKEYEIINNWGAFRIYKDGIEVHSMKSTGTLSEAKKYVMYLMNVA